MSSVKRVSTARQVLVSALAKVQAGWTQNTAARTTRGREQVCASHAIRSVPVRRPYLRAEALQLLRNGIQSFRKQAVNPEREVSIIGFNDLPGRTKSEVVAAFRKAIRLA